MLYFAYGDGFYPFRPSDAIEKMWNSVDDPEKYTNYNPYMFYANNVWNFSEKFYKELEQDV